MFKFYLYKFGQFLVTRLPLSLSYRFAIFLSELHYHFSFRDRNIVKENLRAVLQTDKNLDVLAKEVFRNFGRYLMEFFRMDRDKNITESIKVEGEHFLKDALAHGKGGIITTAHIGNWELGAIGISLLGYPVGAVALLHKERPVNDLFNAQRESQGVTVIPIHHALRQCIEALKFNNCVAIVADRDFTSNGFIMNFFGRKTLLPKGAAILSCKTGAPIVPTFLMRNDDGSFTLEFLEAIHPPIHSEGRVDDQVLKHVINQYIPILENKIRRFPTQWLMFRPFWLKEGKRENNPNVDTWEYSKK